jgi:hypothetical protein
MHSNYQGGVAFLERQAVPGPQDVIPAVATPCHPERTSNAYDQSPVRPVDPKDALHAAGDGHVEKIGAPNAAKLIGRLPWPFFPPLFPRLTQGQSRFASRRSALFISIFP